MKNVLSLVWLALAVSAQAHESALPHGHSLNQEHSDLFLWSVAGLALAALAAALACRKQNRPQR
jgi:hypothetical protein